MASNQHFYDPMNLMRIDILYMYSYIAAIVFTVKTEGKKTPKPNPNQKKTIILLIQNMSAISNREISGLS